MSVSVKTHKTRRYQEPAPLLSKLAAGIAWLAIVASWFMGRQVLDSTVRVQPGESETVKQLNLKPNAIGATRIDARARIPAYNRWLTYEIQLLDAEGEPIAAAVKQAWKESGTWYEDGESGTWRESDLRSALDVEAESASEEVTLAIAVLEYTDTSGTPIDDTVAVEVNVRQGVVDRRYLWPGAIAATILAFLTSLAMDENGRKAIAKTINDSDIGDRAVLGGKNRLVKLVVTVRSDETTPKPLNIDLWLRDGNGEDLHHHRYPVSPIYLSSDDFRSVLATYFHLPKRGSYGFYVEVVPDAPVDRTELEVFERVKTRGAVEVTTIEVED